MKNSFIIILLFSFLKFNAQETFTLEEAVEYALNNSYTTKNADLNIESAKKKKWETTTIGLPQISATADYQHFIKQATSLLPAEIFGGPPGTFAEVSFGTKQNVNATATLSQLLFDGSYLVGLQSAKVFLKISELAKIKTEQAVREAVISAYGNVLLSEESILILKNNLIILDKNVYDTQQLINEGFSEEQDVEQLQITRSNIKNQLNRAKRILGISEKVLKLTMGIDIEKPIKLTETLEILVDKNTDISLYNFDLNIDNHIDYKIAKNSVTAKELLMKFEKSKALPSLSTFVNYGVTANNDKFNFTNSNQKWFDSSLFGVSLNVPIFSSFKRRSRTQQAGIALDQSKIDLTETEQTLKLAVATAKTNYQFAIDNYQTTKESLSLAERIEHKEQIKYAEGIGSSFNLSTAQNQLYTMQQNYLQTIVDIINSKVKLENALNN